MTLIDQSLFGNSLYVNKKNEFHVQPDYPLNELSQETGKMSYLYQIKFEQSQISQLIFEEINNKLSKMESVVLQEIPQIKSIYKENQTYFQSAIKLPQQIKLGRLADTVTIFPKLFTYQIPQDSNSHFTLPDIAQMVYANCSEILLLKSVSNSLLVFDLKTKQVSYCFKDWPFNLNKILIKRNLNSYKSKLMTQKNFIRLSNFPKKIEILYEEEKKEELESENIILQKTLGNTLYSVKVTKEYFRNMKSQLWVTPEFQNDSYAIVLKDDLMDELLFFKLEFCYKNRTKNKNMLRNSMRNNEYSLSLIYDQKEIQKENNSKKPSKRYFKRIKIILKVCVYLLFRE